MGIPTILQRPPTVPCTALTAGKMPAVSAVQGDCERVYGPGVITASIWWDELQMERDHLTLSGAGLLSTEGNGAQIYMGLNGRISNHVPSEVWDEITYPFPNFNSATVEVWGWISNFIPHFIMGVITYPCYDES